jgi:hypothetical protein
VENMTTIQLCSTKQVKFQASLTELISTYFLGNMEEKRNQESRAQGRLLTGSLPANSKWPGTGNNHLQRRI